MSTPLILTTTHRAHDGKRDELRRAADAYAAFVEHSEPGLVALAVTTDDASVTFEHVFTDATAADEHLTTSSGHIADSFAIAQTARISAVGTPGPRVTGLLAANREAGVPVDAVDSVNGFVRD
ncbi:hypothetical protein GCM10023169_32990 [Georgenia halophila]|uniref:Antibiotic biosynthesis monooxygenase n=1 Tax=Georgenia halophila TaxID=620889 RepID=A0ABP8LJQ8_9MICO